MEISPDVNRGFDKLERLLLDMRSGDEVVVADAARTTGLSNELCLAVLQGLERAALMTRASSDRFVRRTADGGVTGGGETR